MNDNKWTLTESKDICQLFIELGIILVEFGEAIIDCSAISVMFHFPGGLKFFNCRESPPEGRMFLSREKLFNVGSYWSPCNFEGLVTYQT